MKKYEECAVVSCLNSYHGAGTEKYSHDTNFLGRNLSTGITAQEEWLLGSDIRGTRER